jgi:tetratricopeptide (TPR) repeat protein
MKRRLMLAVIVIAACNLLAPRPATADPSDRFLEAYFLIQEADAAERQADWPKAASKYTDALEILQEINTTAPHWNPHIIEFRLEYCRDHLARIKPRVPAPAPPPAVQPPGPPPLADVPMVEPPAEDFAPLAQPPLLEAPVMPPVAPPVAAADTEEVRRLTADLEAARRRIAELETGREELQTKLQDALMQVEPGATDPRVEELLRQNRDMAAQLATAQTELAALRAAAQPPPAVVPPPDEGAVVLQLRADLSQARAELALKEQQLADARRDLGAARQELESARSELRGLRMSYDEIVAQLSEANRRLSTWQAAREKDDEIILQLRKENALLRAIVDRRTVGTRQQTDISGPTIPELKGWRPRRLRQQEAETPAVARRPEPAADASDPGKLVATMTAPTARESFPPEQPGIDPPVLLEEARRFMDARDYERAAGRYLAVLARESDHRQALTGVGVARYHQGRHDEAVQFLERAVKLAPNDGHTRSVLGIVYYRKGRLRDAFDELTRATALDPANAEAHNYLGIVLTGQGQLDAAVAQLQKAVASNPRYADAHFNLAVLHTRTQPPRYDLARDHYRKALELGAAADERLETLLRAQTGRPTGEPPDIQ